MEFRKLNKFGGKIRTNLRINMLEVYAAINATPFGEYCQFDVEDERQASSVQTSLYGAYNKNLGFVKTRGFGISISIQDTTVTVWKRKPEDVELGKPSTREHNVDKTQLAEGMKVKFKKKRAPYASRVKIAKKTKGSRVSAVGAPQSA
jgi:hypothetical protein